MPNDKRFEEPDEPPVPTEQLPATEDGQDNPEDRQQILESLLGMVGEVATETAEINVRKWRERHNKRTRDPLTQEPEPVQDPGNDIAEDVASTAPILPKANKTPKSLHKFDKLGRLVIRGKILTPEVDQANDAELSRKVVRILNASDLNSETQDRIQSLDIEPTEVVIKVDGSLCVNGEILQCDSRAIRVINELLFNYLETSVDMHTLGSVCGFGGSIKQDSLPENGLKNLQEIVLRLLNYKIAIFDRKTKMIGTHPLLLVDERVSRAS